MAGFQRYNRESNHASEQDSKPVLQQAVADCPVLCEYCGERTRPKLDLTLLDIPKTGGQFCCAQYQKLYGSVQVFYPSGSVALVVLVTEANGRVCVVYDDKDDVPEQPIRALFQSDGRATCYHSNGSIWFSLGQSGGQRLDKSGARVQRWSWSRPGCSPTPLRPLFLSLNKNVGVRILGQDQVFVSFLCCGQQARFSVGICCVQDYINRSSVPSIRSEELFLLAARMGVCLAIEGLRHYMRRFSSHKPFTAKLCQRHHLRVIEKLLRASNTAETSASDKAFIHRCLRNYL
ncbi:hypothetical protein NHX12_003625 [Muraenolepis orangiensis]|uniref:FAM194 C-terminal domain-containing protein n=1 Tax=Muraenolepis orangiensis TaxID=630683 RepID=A0A9Q0DVJ5_9TELE|nr:hypothetical protein NHX12_003625 [Muraenolepis orangiensis]